MSQTIINTTITFVISSVLGYCVSVIKNYKKKLEDKKESEKAVLETILKKFAELEESQLTDMKNDLSNKFYVYDALEEVDDYLVMSFREKCERYFKMGGDSWIHPMYDQSFKWKLKPTGYLK